MRRTRRFNALEILCEGPNWPRQAPSRAIADSLQGRGLEVYMHSPTIDLNPASVNRGIREETERQLRESVDMAVIIGARFVTTHLGVVHKDKVRGFCSEYAMQLLGEVSDYARTRDVTLSIENAVRTCLCKARRASGFPAPCGCGMPWPSGTRSCPEPWFSRWTVFLLHVNDNMAARTNLCQRQLLDLCKLDGRERMIINSMTKVLRARQAIMSTLSSLEMSPDA
jgi:hypothetical protein